MSASISPTLYPSFPSATTRLTATVVLPTPPLPLPTATTCATPGKGCGPCGVCGAPAPICPIQKSPVLRLAATLLGILLVLRSNDHPDRPHEEEHRTQKQRHCLARRK